MASLLSVQPANLSDEELEPTLLSLEDYQQRATRQMSHLESQIHYLKTLFRRADKNGNHAVRYNLRMQLSIAGGLKVMYHNYLVLVRHKSNEIRDRIENMPESTLEADEC